MNKDLSSKEESKIKRRDKKEAKKRFGMVMDGGNLKRVQLELNKKSLDTKDLNA